MTKTGLEYYNTTWVHVNQSDPMQEKEMAKMLYAQ